MSSSSLHSFITMITVNPSLNYTVNTRTQELIQLDPLQALNTKGEDRQIQ